MTDRRSGTTSIELTASMIILAAVLLAIAQTAAMRAQQRRVAERHLLATNEAANLMERIIARSWDDVTSDHVAALMLSAEARGTLPDAGLKIDVDTVQELEGAAKRVRVEIDWQNSAGQRETAVGLTAWKYRVERTE